ncbi:MAG: hypothetical protein AAF988_05800 [Pseudomonadota bacterium]
MVYIFFVPLIVISFLSFFLLKALKNKKRREKAFLYGKENFDIELPSNTNAFRGTRGYQLPALANVSDAENFMMLIVPYLGSLPIEKRDKLQKETDILASDLKMNKEIYRFVMDELEKYDGLSDDEASQKWRGKNDA